MFLPAGPTAPSLGPSVDSLVVQQCVFVAGLEPTARMVASTIICFISILKRKIDVQLTQIGSVSNGHILCGAPSGFLLSPV